MIARLPIRPRPVVAAVGVVLAAGAVAATALVPAHLAAGSQADGAVSPVAALVPDETLDPRLVALDLRGDGWSAAVERLESALFTRAENDREWRGAERLLGELQAERRIVVMARADADGQLAALRAELAAVDEILRARALEQYVHFGDDPVVELLVDSTSDTDRRRGEELSRHVDEVQLGTRTELRETYDSRVREIDSLAGRLLQLDLSIASAEVRRERAALLAPLFEAEVDTAIVGVRRARRSATIAGLDISVVALDAYLNAERLLGQAFAGCNAEWWMIAGVARVESRHGRIGGRELQAAGRPSAPIIGIALDGGPGVRAIHDTDDGRYDGDEEWDRAVGPLQFIPETWRGRGRDATGDGVADPQNIYDAAYSAGRYLCALGGDLSSRGALRAAFFGYNNSTAYVDAVITHADRYSTFELPSLTSAEALANGAAVVDAVENAG